MLSTGASRTPAGPTIRAMAPTFSIAEFHPGSFCVFRGDVPAASLVGRRKKVPITRFFGAIPAGIEFPQWAVNSAGRAEFSFPPDKTNIIVVSDHGFGHSAYGVDVTGELIKAGPGRQVRRRRTQRPGVPAVGGFEDVGQVATRIGGDGVKDLPVRRRGGWSQGKSRQRPRAPAIER